MSERTKSKQEINQEAFDLVYNSMLNQGRACKNTSDINLNGRNFGPGEANLYYGDAGCDGDRCAIGFLIPEDEYSRFLEDKVVGVVQSLVPALSQINTHLLYSLQEVHDNIIPSEWPIALDRVAAEHNLQVPVRNDNSCKQLSRRNFPSTSYIEDSKIFKEE